MHTQRNCLVRYSVLTIEARKKLFNGATRLENLAQSYVEVVEQQVL